MRGSRRTRRVGLPVALLAAAALLSGCTSSPVGAVASVSAEPSASASTPVPVVTPSTPPPTQVAADATPVDVRCGKLVPKAVARQLVPQLTTVRDWQPAATAPAHRLFELNGTACAWTDDAGDRLEVAVAKPSKADAVALKNDLVRRSNSVPTYGGEAYFQVAEHMGQVDAFRGRTWISARSNRFFEPGDAIPVMASIDDAFGFAHTPSPSDSPTAPAPTGTPAPQTPAPSPTPTP